MKIKLSITMFALLLLLSCNGKKDRPAFYDSDNIVSDSTDNTTFSDSNQISNSERIIAVPFKEEGGVKYIKVSVNGLDIEMIFDTGCSGTLISVAEANYLYQKGYLTEGDYMGNSQSQIADGSIVENMVFNLKDVIIDNKLHCNNVTATVSSNNKAPLLLGNEVLNRVASYTIDNERRIINFKLK